RVRQPSEQQARMTEGELFEVLNVSRVRPALLVSNERIHAFEDPLHASAVRKLEGEQVVLGRGEDLAKRRHRVEVEERIVVRLGAPKLLRKAAIGRNLMRGDHRLEAVTAITRQFAVRGEPGELSYLHCPAGAVIVRGLSLLLPVRRGGHPVEIVGEPFADAISLVITEYS